MEEKEDTFTVRWSAKVAVIFCVGGVKVSFHLFTKVNRFYLSEGSLFLHHSRAFNFAFYRVRGTEGNFPDKRSKVKRYYAA